jgi:hypothetical protein
LGQAHTPAELLVNDRQVQVPVSAAKFFKGSVEATCFSREHDLGIGEIGGRQSYFSKK